MWQLSENELDKGQYLYKRFYEKAMKRKVLFIVILGNRRIEQQLKKKSNSWKIGSVNNYRN